jgi:hypothetical protein
MIKRNGNRHRPDWESSEWKARKPVRPPTLRQLEVIALRTFLSIYRHYGMEKACQVFENYVREASKPELKNREMYILLGRLANMQRPNVKHLVRDVLAEQGIERSDARFPNKSEALEKKIRRWKKRWPALKAAFGPVSPPQGPDEPVRFVFHKAKKQK